MEHTKQPMTLEQFIDAMAHETVDWYESMDPLADPQPASFYRSSMGKVLIHTEKRGPAFDNRPDDDCGEPPEEQDEAEARAEREYRNLDRGEL